MTKLALAIHLINRFRIEKNPPYLRYACLLALAESPEPMEPLHIFRRFNMEFTSKGTLPSAARAGLIEELTIKGKPHYRLTSAGQDLVRELLTPSADIPANL